MKYRRLGRTDIEVSAVAMGCWALAGGHTWGSQDEADSIATVHAALDAGVNFFDTAEGYGDGYSEEVLGRALKGRRHETVVATKVSRRNLAHDAVLQACERSLRRLQTDVIDLYQIHWPGRTVPLAETFAALEKLRDQGKVRAIGMSNFGIGDLTDLLTIGHCQTDQLPYSLLWRAIEHEIQPKCVDESIGILCYSPLMQGLLTGKYTSPDEVPDGRARTRHFSKDRPSVRHGEPGCEAETFAAIARVRQISASVGESMAKVSVAWLLAQPGVNAVLAGARKPEQIRETAQAAALTLAPETIEALTEATEKVKQLLGTSPDIWGGKAEGRFR
ncbi:MAG: aldo/keto reductase [Anaerolineae bacterium]|nr:aldo/keto reductase [Anaerolineae bacterium]